MPSVTNSFMRGYGLRLKAFPLARLNCSHTTAQSIAMQMETTVPTGCNDPALARPIHAVDSSANSSYSAQLAEFGIDLIYHRPMRVAPAAGQNHFLTYFGRSRLTKHQYMKKFVMRFRFTENEDFDGGNT